MLTRSHKGNPHSTNVKTLIDAVLWFDCWCAFDRSGVAGWLSLMLVGSFRTRRKKPGTSTTISVPKRTLRATNFLKFGSKQLLTRTFEILKDSLASFMLLSRFYPKRYYESEVSLSHSVLMSSFKTSFKHSLHSADIYLCAMPIKVIESTVWPINFLRLGGLLSFCVSISSSAISRTADVAKINHFWISDNLLSAL